MKKNKIIAALIMCALMSDLYAGRDKERYIFKQGYGKSKSDSFKQGPGRKIAGTPASNYSAPQHQPRTSASNSEVPKKSAVTLSKGAKRVDDGGF